MSHTVSISDALYARVKADADARGLTVSAWVASRLDSALDQPAWLEKLLSQPIEVPGKVNIDGLK